MAESEVDGRRVRGDASRRLILEHATDLASVEGLDGLTIGRLAAASGVSKSSIATLFGNKEALQLAAVDAAAAVFREVVVEPARTRPRGIQRVSALLRGALDYSRTRHFAGGCFFAATMADVDSKPGPVRDALNAWLRTWHGYLEAQVQHAIDAGDVRAEPDTARMLAFELSALFNEANSRSLMSGESEPYAIAAAVMRSRLREAGAPEAHLTALG